ncbi:accessory gene regulator B family protein [Lachnospiraceae bacterium LCP25S3_G4]
MITRIAEGIANFFAHKHLIPEDEKEIIRYGVEISISTIWGYVLLLTTGLLIGRFVDSCIFAILFMWLRLYAGGYHANSYHACSFAMVISMLCALGTAELLRVWNNFIMLLLLGLCCNSIIFIIAPIENVHKKLSSKQKKKFHFISVAIGILYYMVAFILYFYHLEACWMIIATLIIVTFLALVGKVGELNVKANRSM